MYKTSTGNAKDYIFCLTIRCHFEPPIEALILTRIMLFVTIGNPKFCFCFGYRLVLKEVILDLYGSDVLDYCIKIKAQFQTNLSELVDNIPETK